MQPVSRDVIEALEAQIRERLPAPLKDEATNMAPIVLRVLGDAAGEVQPPRNQADLDALRIVLLTTLGIASPESRQSLDHTFRQRISVLRAKYGSPHLDADEVDQAVALSLFITIASPGTSYFYKELGEILHNSGRPWLALPWLEFARRLHAHQIFSRYPVPQTERVIYSLFLRDEAHCQADLGNFTQAIDLRLKAHALNPDDPDYSQIERWSKEAIINEPIQRMSLGGGGRLPALILAVSNILIAPSPHPGEELRNVTTPQTALPKTRIVGDVRNRFADHVPEIRFSLTRFEKVRIYTDYWKTAVTDEAGRLLRGVGCGPPELVSLASQAGFGPDYRDLPGVTVAVTHNHNWFEYYHWLIQLAPRIGFLLESGVAFDHVIAQGAFSRSYCQEFLSLSGLDAKNVLGGSDPISVRAPEAIFPSRPEAITPFGIAFLRTLYLGGTPVRMSGGRRLMISRQKAKDRRIANYEPLHALVARFGFEVVSFEDMDVRAQAALMAEAEVVVAPHGAGLSNVVFCPPRATVIELIPIGSPVTFQMLSHQCGLEYVAVQADWFGTNLVIDVDHLRAALRLTGIA